MDTSGFDTVARHIPLYRERLLALPGWVKDQAFDIHIASGQPLSLSGKEGALFLGKKGVTRRLSGGHCHHAPAAAGAVPGSLRPLGVPPRGGASPGLCAPGGEPPGGRVRHRGWRRAARCAPLRDITALVYRISPAGARLRGQALSGGRSLRARRAGGGAPSSGKTTFLRDVARSLSLGRFGPSRRVAVVDERGELGGYGLGPQRRRAPGLPQGRRAGRGYPHPLPGGGRPRRALPGGLGGRPGGGRGGGGAAGLCPRGSGAPFPAPPCAGPWWESGAFGTAVVPCRGGACRGEVAALVPVGSEGGVGRHEAFGSGAAGGQRAAGGPGRGGAPQAPGPAVA